MVWNWASGTTGSTSVCSSAQAGTLVLRFAGWIRKLCLPSFRKDKYISCYHCSWMQKHTPRTAWQCNLLMERCYLDENCCWSREGRITVGFLGVGLPIKLGVLFLFCFFPCSPLWKTLLRRKCHVLVLQITTCEMGHSYQVSVWL